MSRKARLSVRAAVISAVSVLIGVMASVAAASGGAVKAHSSMPTLVVYSAQGYDKSVVTAFSKATGIPTKLDDNSTGPLLTQIEASKNNPNWGLLWVDGDTAFASLDQQHMLMRGFEPMVHWTKLAKSLLPADKSYTPSGLTAMAVMVYDKTKVTVPPTSWQQLLSAKWKGAVGMNDPSQSGPTYPFIAGIMQHLGGVAKGKAYFAKLKANGLVVNPTNGPTLQALTNGQIKLALVQSSAGVGAALGDKNLVVKYLNPATLLPGVMGIDAKAPAAVQKEAEKFEQFVLSKAGQKAMQAGDPTGDSLYYPVITGVKPLKGLPPLAMVKTQRLNPYVWGKRESAINSWFDTSIK